MEKMACDSIEKEPKCENFVINIPREHPDQWLEWCIYRVPKQLRKVNRDAYTPKLVSIGPFHHGNDDLKDMEKHKQSYLKHFLDRTKKESPADFLKIIKHKEVNILQSYSEDCGLESGAFVQMILLDAIFIIELFLKVRYIVDKKKEDEEEAQRKGKKKEESEEDQRERKNVEEDYILHKPWLESGIRDDLILLENQLPFFVLEDLYRAASCDSSKLEGDFLKLSQIYFSCYNKTQMSNIGGEVKHFTDLVRYFYYSTPLEPTGSFDHLCSATELDEAGLIFKGWIFKEVEEHTELDVEEQRRRFEEQRRRLLDITFHENKFLKYCPCFNLSWLLACLPCLKKSFPCLEGMERLLEVPRFAIDDSTECLFRNLMALEQCHYPLNAYICNYVSLLDDLINTEKDVALLVDKKVIVNHLGSNTAVATLINELCKGIVFDGSCYSALCKDIVKYRDNPWNQIMASMKRVYFRDFWRGAATVVGLVVLVFTLWNFVAPLLSTTLRLGGFFPFFF